MPRVTPEDGHTHLPLRIALQTPSRIETADGRSISVSWERRPADNPYAEAEAFAAYLVRAANSHEDLVKVLGDLLNCVDGAHDPEWLRRTKEAAVAALAKALGQEER